jgi:ABC-2 type transport system permease protein
MLRLLRLLGATMLLSLQRDLAFRTDFVIRVLVTAVAAAGTIGTLAAVYARVDSLEGWEYGDGVVVLGMFVMVNGVLQATVEPNLEWFQAKIRNGALDDILLKPAPDAFLASFATARPMALVDVPIGAGIVAFGLSRVEASITVLDVASCVALLASGMVVAWALRFVLAASAFWAGGLELTVLFNAPWQLGRFPSDLYGSGVALVLTYVVPIALVSTLPARSLVGATSPWSIVTAGVVSLAAAAVALGVWRRGVRGYTSATS